MVQIDDQPEILWSPAADERCRLDDFGDQLVAAGLPEFDNYEELWRWSVTEPNEFWLQVWRYFDIPADPPAGPTVALSNEAMPGAIWFPEIAVNYAEVMLQAPGRNDDDVIIISRSQTRAEVQLTVREFRDMVARVRGGLERSGVTSGDRVAAYSPNIPETMAVMLAAASMGAVFSSCAPEFGTQSVVDRLRQIEPKVLVTVDGYRYGAKDIDRREEIDAIRAALPSVKTTVWIDYLYPGEHHDDSISWQDFTASAGELKFQRVPFDHPLYILFSSGTTGLPKPIIHGHGGITIEHLKSLALQTDLGSDDRFFWFSTTGWMMWNYLVSAIGVGSTIIMFDGNPAYPDAGMLWRLAGETAMTYFGTSAPFLMQCRKEAIEPARIADLSALRGIGSTGAPLPAEGFRWVYDAVKADVHLGSLSGGTDTCTGLVGAARTVPVTAGEIACRCLGAAVEAYDSQGRPVINQLGELVVERPMPSMPVGFWNDADGSRYHAAYFEDIPGVWRQGDWITITDRGTCVITGRSDATLNRGGVRLGTSEFYTVVESIPDIVDSLVVHLEDDEGGAGTLYLFVQLAEGVSLDDDVRTRISGALRRELSPRHVPDVIHALSALPRTLSGKKLEVPVKKILQGTPVTKAASKGAITAPESLEEFARLGTA